MGIQERKRREREGRRRQILGAARRLFAARGFHSATMEEIAREAELSPGTLYLYFNSKDELFAALSMEVLRYFIQRLEDLCADAGMESEARFAAVKDILQDLCSFDAFILVNALRIQSQETLSRLSPALLDELCRHIGRAHDLMCDIIETGIREGRLLPGDPQICCEVLWAVFAGAVLVNEIQGHFNPDATHLPVMLENAFDVFARGIRAPAH